MGRQLGYNRDEVLRSSVGLFLEHGFHRVSVQDLVNTTGINRFAIYEKFSGKEGLFYDTLDFYLDAIIRQELLAPLFSEDSSLDTLLGTLCVVRDINKDESRRPGCLIVNANIELGGRDQRVAQATESLNELFREATAHTLNCAHQAGDLRSDKSSQQCANHMAIQIQAFFALAYISREAADRLITALIEEVQSWRAGESIVTA
jgi:TetR/AcrR family transcriptional repressor of nem operon